MDQLIERIKVRIEEVGDCWEWRGAMQSVAPTPTMRFRDTTMPVRRAIAIVQGKEVEGKVVTCKCRNELCVNPDHVMVVTRRKLQTLIAKERDYATNPARRKRISDRARVHAKLTPEIAEQIRQAEGKQRDIAAQFGVTQATVSAIKQGKTWKDYSNPFIGLMK